MPRRLSHTSFRLVKHHQDALRHPAKGGPTVGLETEKLHLGKKIPDLKNRFLLGRLLLFKML